MDVDQMMARMGFSAEDRGPYVTLLRENVARQAGKGMIGRSAGSWAEEAYQRDENGFIVGYAISAEERARAMLEVDWHVEHGHSCERKLVDSGPFGWSFDTATMRWKLQVRPRLLLPWLGDRCRELGMRFRIWRDRLAGVKNPYAREGAQ